MRGGILALNGDLLIISTVASISLVIYGSIWEDLSDGFCRRFLYHLIVEDNTSLCKWTESSIYNFEQLQRTENGSENWDYLLTIY